MAIRNEKVNIAVDDESIAGTFLAPDSKVPGVLFVHGWGGSQRSDLVRAKGISGLGCICLTFDLRGHERTLDQRKTVSRSENLNDLLTTLRPVKWLALHVPALYRDTEWDAPKRSLDREDIALYRRTPVSPDENRALSACAGFEGDVLIVESEHDDFIPHQTIMNYRAAFIKSHSLTHRILDGADHALTGELSQAAYNDILLKWTTEMFIGARVGNNLHHWTADMGQQ
jgi:pimeloyl-ACP methyl ester carboxylesterase